MMIPKYFINPTGRFVIGGPQGDAGFNGPQDHRGHLWRGLLTMAGVAFSGKDATKVDRSASYAALLYCQNLVAAGYAKRLEIQVAYAIGVAQQSQSQSIRLGRGTRSEAELIAAVRKTVWSAAGRNH